MISETYRLQVGDHLHFKDEGIRALVQVEKAPGHDASCVKVRIIKIMNTKFSGDLRRENDLINAHPENLSR